MICLSSHFLIRKIWHDFHNNDVMKYLTYLLLSCMLSLVCFSIACAQNKELSTNNKVYEPTIRTVQLYPTGNSVNSRINPPVTTTGRANSLTLSFDDLREDADYYYVYFLHCNADWQPSNLSSALFLNKYNEFEITEFDFSVESKLQYVHYDIRLPPFKYSGNYLAVVYRNQDKEDIILSRRFYVVDEKVNVGAAIMRSSQTANRLSHQRVEAQLSYANLSVNDPGQQFFVKVVQNQRPDKTRVLSPTFIDDNNRSMRYQNLGDENEFEGGNEFRFFDLSRINMAGRNIAQTSYDGQKVKATLNLDRPFREAYLQQLDINGQFYIKDNESQLGDIAAEYVNVQFQLEAPQYQEDVFVVGAFNNWEKSEENKMRYNLEQGKYTASVLMKQGLYNYKFETKTNSSLISKSFFDTENLYEVFVYYTALGSRGDELVGYFKTNFNARR